MVKEFDDTDDPAGGHFHLDKRIPVALLIGLVLTFITQFAGAVWFVSDLYHLSDANAMKYDTLIIQVKDLDKRSDQFRDEITGLRKDVQHGNRVLEQYIKDQKEYQRRVEDRRYRNGSRPRPTTHPE